MLVGLISISSADEVVLTMSLPPIVTSALREVTDLKIEEFVQLKNDFSKVFHDVTKRKDNEQGDRDAVLTRLKNSLDNIKHWESQVMLDDQFSTWSRRVEQAQNDKSITREKLISMQKDLEEKLQQFMNRLEVSDVHIALLKQALRAPEEKGSVETTMSKMVLEDEFELVENDLESVHAAFEECAFTKKEIDTDAITKYLTELYEDAFGKDHVELVQKEMCSYGDAILNGADHLDTELLEWCIEDLLATGMLSPERERTLRGYLGSESAIHELTDTLNMKSIRNWNWRNAQEGLTVTSRKNAEDKHCIVIEEDIMDVLFLHTLSVRWSIQLKRCLTYLVSFNPRVSHMIPSFEEVSKREYYLHSPRPPPPSTTAVATWQPVSLPGCPSFAQPVSCPPRTRTALC